ncbi:14126_t:CDS:2, partial [Dentiscutata heterogama]
MPKRKNKVYQMLQKYNNKRSRQAKKKQKKNIAKGIFAENICDVDVFAEDVFSDDISAESSEFDEDKSKSKLEEKEE